MRKITFLLTLLLMYVGVTPMMAEYVDAEIDESKTYVIKIKDSQNYIFAEGDKYPTYRTDTPYDATDTKFHFVFVKYNKTTYDDNSKIYYIKSVSSGMWATYFSTSSSTGEPAVELARSQNNQTGLWIVKKEGDTFKIIRAKYNNGFYENSNQCWNPSFGGEPISFSTSPSKSLVIEALDGSEVGGGESGGNEGGGSEEEPTVDYTVYYKDAHANSRRFNNASVNGINIFSNNLNTNIIYHEAIDKIFSVEANSDINIKFEYNGSWMNGYVYIDEDNNGFNAALDANKKPVGDLKSFTFYSGDDDSDYSGYGGTTENVYSVPNASRDVLQPPTFKAPSTAGTYRMRLKIDWNNIDPKGDNIGTNGTIVSNGGVIVDVTLVVTEPINLTLAKISDTDELLYGLTGYIGSFSAPYATLIPDGVEAYYATSKDNMGYITLTPCVASGTSAKGVPANFGVILVSQNQDITLNPASSHIDTPANNVFGNSAGKEVEIGAGDYILASGKQGIGFYESNPGTLAKNKAFLRLGTSQTSALRLVLDETVTGINGVATEKVDAPIYDLSGRRVLNTVKGGIYIQNGKKFIVK